MTNQKNIILHYIHAQNNTKGKVVLDFQETQKKVDKKSFKELLQLSILTEHDPPFMNEKHSNISMSVEQRIERFKRAIDKQNEIEAWIQEHGSEELKTAFELGLHIDGILWKERIDLEYPGWQRNYRIDYEEVINPSKLLIQTYSFIAQQQELDPRGLFLDFYPEEGEAIRYRLKGNDGGVSLVIFMKDIKEAIIDNFRFIAQSNLGLFPAIKAIVESENIPFVKAKFEQLSKNMLDNVSIPLHQVFPGIISPKTAMISSVSGKNGEGFFSYTFLEALDKELSQQLKIR